MRSPTKLWYEFIYSLVSVAENKILTKVWIISIKDISDYIQTQALLLFLRDVAKGVVHSTPLQQRIRAIVG